MRFAPNLQLTATPVDAVQVELGNFASPRPRRMSSFKMAKSRRPEALWRSQKASSLPPGRR